MPFTSPMTVDMVFPRRSDWLTAPATKTGDGRSMTSVPAWRRRFERGSQAVPNATFGRPSVPGYAYRIRQETDPLTFIVRERCRRIGGSMVGVGSLFLILSQLLSLSIAYFIALSNSNAQISIGQFYDALSSSMLGQLVCGVFVLNMIMGIIGFGAGIYIKDDSARAAATAIAIGGAALATSIVVVGGIFGVYGGIFMIVGGALGLVQ